MGGRNPGRGAPKGRTGFLQGQGCSRRTEVRCSLDTGSGGCLAAQPVHTAPRPAWPRVSSKLLLEPLPPPTVGSPGCPAFSEVLSVQASPPPPPQEKPGPCSGLDKALKVKIAQLCPTLRLHGL